MQNKKSNGQIKSGELLGTTLYFILPPNILEKFISYVVNSNTTHDCDVSDASVTFLGQNDNET